MRTIISYALTVVLAIAFASCGNTSATQSMDVLADTTIANADWLQELKMLNKLKDDTNYISVYFKCDNRYANMYEVYGIIYPKYNEQNKDNGWQGWSSMSDAIMIHRNHISGKKFMLIDKKTKNHTFHLPVIDLNTSKICNDTNFNGFRSDDVYTFHYYNEEDSIYLSELYKAHHPVYSKNNYDGQDIAKYEITQMTDTGLVLICTDDPVVFHMVW